MLEEKKRLSMIRSCGSVIDNLFETVYKLKYKNTKSTKLSFVRISSIQINHAVLQDY